MSRKDTTPAHVRERRGKRYSRLRTLGYKGYPDYLRSRHWHQVRQRYFASDLPQECVCGEIQVQLHHMTYERIGDERLTDLVPLCASCHALVHVLERRGEIPLTLEGLLDEGRAQEGRALLRQLAEDRHTAAIDRLATEQRDLLAMTFAARLLRAVAHAKHRHVDISHDLHIVKRLTTPRRRGSDEALARRLRAIEELAYGWKGWGPRKNHDV